MCPQIIPRRRSEFSQTTPRDPASLQDIAAVDTKTKKAQQWAYFRFCVPGQNRTDIYMELSITSYDTIYTCQRHGFLKKRLKK